MFVCFCIYIVCALDLDIHSCCFRLISPAVAAAFYPAGELLQITKQNSCSAGSITFVLHLLKGQDDSFFLFSWVSQRMKHLRPDIYDAFKMFCSTQLHFTLCRFFKQAFGRWQNRKMRPTAATEKHILACFTEWQTLSGLAMISSAAGSDFQCDASWK